MEIDVRGVHDKCEIKKIRYSDDEYLKFSGYGGPSGDLKIFDIVDTEAEEDVTLYLKDIDNLIKALEKAKELWA